MNRRSANSAAGMELQGWGERGSAGAVSGEKEKRLN
jgi:hypothetical protein